MLEHLESSGTKVFMNSHYCVLVKLGGKKETYIDLEDNFKDFVHAFNFSRF